MKSKAVRDELKLRYDSPIHPSLRCEIFKMGSIGETVLCQGTTASFQSEHSGMLINGDPCNELRPPRTAMAVR